MVTLPALDPLPGSDGQEAASGRQRAMPGRQRVAIILFNLGGPDRLDAVRPFLFNLFNDPAIIRVPGPLRLLIATLISRRRAPVAQGIYEKLGGKSPLLENTQAQARALEAALWDLGEVRCFVAMRYWHPMADAVAYDVLDWKPDEVILLPLYPQFSTTTTASSVAAWRRAAKAVGLTASERLVCCYPTEPGFIHGNVRLIRAALEQAAAHGRPRLLFSAHGLPEKIVKSGDPYQRQCELTAAAIVRELGQEGLDWVSCYQSRVGPMKWIGPSTEEEVERAARAGVPLVVAPIAFVSEHSETLVEIAEEYRDLALSHGAPFFAAVPTVGTAAEFIDGLANLVRQVRASGCAEGICNAFGTRQCAAGFTGCPHPGRAAA